MVTITGKGDNPSYNQQKAFNKLKVKLPHMVGEKLSNLEPTDPNFIGETSGTLVRACEKVHEKVGNLFIHGTEKYPKIGVKKLDA